MANQDEIKKLIAELKIATATARKNKTAKIAAYEKQKADAADAAEERSAIELCNRLITKEKLLHVANCGMDYYPVYCLGTDAPSVVGKKMHTATREDLGVKGFHISTFLSKRYTVVFIQITENEMYDTSLGNKDRIFDQEIVVTPGQYICIKW
ncbi:MAG: hypothetical protein KBB70_00685 [Candidatus Pacebacteria bacterium]|jgi:hypothetical protein|nr:hypothetical protein [Candidatus Paceibacterota bacterium]